MPEESSLGYLKYATDHYETWVGLILTEVVVFLIVTAVEASAIISGLPIVLRAAGYILPLVGVCTHWSLNRYRLPRNSKGMIGIVVAIYCEEKYQEVRLRNDFLTQLKGQLGALESGNINLMLIKNHQSKNIVEGLDEKLARSIHKKTKAHYILFGSIKKRLSATPKYSVHLDGSILHLDQGPQLKTAIKNEFLAALDRVVDFEEIAELKGFESTADMVARSVKFIVGIAALVSFDIELAYRLHSALSMDLNSLKAPEKQLVELKKKVRKYLCDEERLLAIAYYSQGKAADGKIMLDRLLLRDPHNYGGLLFQAIVDFHEKRIGKSLERILLARQHARLGQEWRYSLAFLYFWTGKYQQALDLCTQIQKSSFPNEGRTVAEVLNFLNGLVKGDDARSQVFFWQGFVLYKKGNHLPGALAALEEFEKRATHAEELLLRRSAIYLKEIKQGMGIS